MCNTVLLKDEFLLFEKWLGRRILFQSLLHEQNGRYEVTLIFSASESTNAAAIYYLLNLVIYRRNRTRRFSDFRSSNMFFQVCFFTESSPYGWIDISRNKTRRI